MGGVEEWRNAWVEEWVVWRSGGMHGRGSGGVEECGWRCVYVVRVAYWCIVCGCVVCVARVVVETVFFPQGGMICV